jgi:hypothetical protein
MEVLTDSATAPATLPPWNWAAIDINKFPFDFWEEDSTKPIRMPDLKKHLTTEFIIVYEQSTMVAWNPRSCCVLARGSSCDFSKLPN